MRQALALISLLFVSVSLYGAERLIAFPGAQGYGRFATGGRGGDVYHVTSLDDSGPGTLREGIKSIKADMPRTIVFDVSGNISLKKDLRIENVDGLTIAGQTAPGDGIMIKDNTLKILKGSSNIILRYLRCRLGDASQTSNDSLDVGSEPETLHDVILDHMTLTWGVDGNMDTEMLSNFTMQWCLVGEALHDSCHYKKQPHAMLMSFRKTQGNVSIHHNLLFSSRDRHPTLGGGEPKKSNPKAIFDFRNNVIYNWEGACNLASGQFNLVGNYWRPGPNTDFKRDPFPIAPKAEAHDVTVGFFANNHFEDKPVWNADNYSAFQFGTRGGKYIGEVTKEKFVQPAEFVAQADRPTTHHAEEAYKLVLASAGASKARDAADQRVVDGIMARTHRRIDSQEEVGGWPELKSLPALQDTDRDGMSDAWEKTHGLNPADPDDRHDTTKDGYTQLEQYLNVLVSEVAGKK
ncbi:MAG: pectate lyase family protein [Roseimicrobium sp.]